MAGASSVDPAHAVKKYEAALRRVAIQLALLLRDEDAWPAPADRCVRITTLLDLAGYAASGPNVNSANRRTLEWITSGSRGDAEAYAHSQGKTALADSRRLAWNFLKGTTYDLANAELQIYLAEFAAYKSDFFEHKFNGGLHPGPPPLYTPAPGDPVLTIIESEAFLLAVFNPFFNKRYGPSGPAMPKRFVWNATGDLTPGWGAFMKELAKHVASIALMQLAADDTRLNYLYARTSEFTDQWTRHLDRILYDWLEDAVTRGVIPATEVRSAFDRYTNKTVYVPK